ncbi:MAG: tetratricopeptide (TPR) repeat protein [Saprospiraceae bacterium]|jgi:tetratricopeptide (TPR) repeat protein
MKIAKNIYWMLNNKAWRSSFKLIVFLLLFPLLLGAQESKLAQQYFTNGEFEKASTLYEKLYDKSNKNEFYFNRFIDCLLALEEYDRTEEILKKKIKKNPKDVQLYVTLGNLFERKLQDEKAKEQYDKAIDKMTADQFVVTRLANAFRNLTKYDYAIDVYEKGGDLLKDKFVFSNNLGNLYRIKGENSKMIENYLNSLSSAPTRLSSLQTIFQRYLSVEEFDELQAQLYSRIDASPDDIQYSELLAWVFIQRKDYLNAIRQMKALDRKLGETGIRVFKIGEIAEKDKDYDAAIQAYNYIIEEKGLASGIYIESKKAYLSCKRKKIVEGFHYTDTDLKDLEAEYEIFLNEFGRNKTTSPIIAELADLEAFYLNDRQKAIGLLTEMIEYPGLDQYVMAKGKLSLADFYLMDSEIWEATLLYSQVDKAFTEDILGHEARYRNAKLSYYAGDFEWAQAQFDVLKASTSKLIANDALDLSVFILDNLGLDSTVAPLKLYAEADLLVFQNRFDDAFIKLDSLKTTFPDHSLEDDIYYTYAKIYLKQREFTKSAEMLQLIIDKYPEGIRADNALYELAMLYENQLNDIEKAKELYEKIFIEYSGSTFAVDARKRFRKLRGDDI